PISRQPPTFPATNPKTRHLTRSGTERTVTTMLTRTFYSTLRRALRLAMTLALILGFARQSLAAEDSPPVSGSGGLEAHRADGTPLGACPLKHTDVATEIAGFVARVVVTQTFANPFNEPVEAIYTFPLSDRAAVDAMTMRTGDRVIRGD